MNQKKIKEINQNDDWADYVQAKKAKSPAFALAYQIEFDRLQLARRIKALREKQDVTQEELAELVGTRQPAIARLEAGNVLPRLDLLERIAHALGTHLDVKFVRNQVVTAK